MKTATAVIVLVAVIALGYLALGRRSPEPLGSDAAPVASTTQPAAPATTTDNPPSMTTPEGLQIDVLAEGSGPAAEAGDTVDVHYTGWLTNGQKFDSSVDRGTPFSFTLGAGQVIRGWDLGVAGMKVGEKRKLTIPPELGYGAAGAGGVIPPNATLVFEVELLGIR